MMKRCAYHTCMAWLTRVQWVVHLQRGGGASKVLGPIDRPFGAVARGEPTVMVRYHRDALLQVCACQPMQYT